LLWPQFVLGRALVRLERARLALRAHKTTLALLALKNVELTSSASIPALHGFEKQFGILAPGSSHSHEFGMSPERKPQAAARLSENFYSGMALKRVGMSERVELPQQTILHDSICKFLPQGSTIEANLTTELAEVVLARPAEFGLRSSSRVGSQRKTALKRRGMSDAQLGEIATQARKGFQFWQERIGSSMGTDVSDVINRNEGNVDVDPKCPPLPVLWLLTRSDTNYWSGIPGGVASASVEYLSGSVRLARFRSLQAGTDALASVRRLAVAIE